MNKSFLSKLNTLLILSVLMVVVFATSAFSFWYEYDKVDGIIWLNEDASYPKDGWMFLDEDNDGLGYYYFFDEDGKLLVDTITPDYKIVNEKGRLIDNRTGKAVTFGSNANVAESSDSTGYKSAEDFLRKELGFSATSKDLRLAKLPETQTTTRKKNLNEIIVPGEKPQVLIGKNVVFHAEDEDYDPDIDRHVVNHITGGNEYSKKVNGTIFTKTKWTGVIALKGDGANFIATNEKNNFNRVKGKIATHYFTYSDRTTICTFSIWDVDNEEELYATSGFNYNGGINFDVTFFRTTVNRLRFELSVEGQYPKRVAYIKDLVFSFDRQAYKEELEELEEEAIIESMYLDSANIGTVSEAEVVDYDVDEDGQIIMKGNEDYAGPAFDKSFTATVSQAIAPDGTVINNLRPGKEG